MPHKDLTKEQIASCAAYNIPTPPADAVLFDANSYDWRYPGDGPRTAETPTQFRWQFDQRGQLTVFCAYGWRSRLVGFGRGATDPEWGYSRLSAKERDAAARRELMETCCDAGT